MRDYSKPQDGGGLPVALDAGDSDIPANFVQVYPSGVSLSHAGKHAEQERLALPQRSAEAGQLRRAGRLM